MQLKSLNTLFVKIFIGFWILILLLTSSLILLPRLDTRLIHSPTSSDVQRLENHQKLVTQHSIDNQHMPLSELLNTKPLKNSQYQIYLTTENGNLINEKAPNKMRHFIASSEDALNPLKQINLFKTYLGPVQVDINGKPHRLYFAYLNQKKSLEAVEWLLDNPLLLIIVCLVVTSPICAYISWRLSSPLRQLKETAIEISKGKLDTQFPTMKSNEECNELAYSMQIMVSSLKNMLTNQQRLLSDISHELRSPLTRLNLALAIAKKQDQGHQALTRIEVEAERMEIMISEMLDISRIQLTKQDLVYIPLNQFFEDLFLDAQFEAQQNGKQFNYPKLDTEQMIKHEISVYHELAYRAIENIIRNAIKYAQQNICAEIAIEEKSITISIRNDGPLIPEKELENIFRPFYRLHESRDRETGGCGLGLSIAENAMFKHAGKIWAENRDDQVYMFLQFPYIAKSKLD